MHPIDHHKTEILKLVDNFISEDKGTCVDFALKVRAHLTTALARQPFEVRGTTLLWLEWSETKNTWFFGNHVSTTVVHGDEYVVDTTIRQFKDLDSSLPVVAIWPLAKWWKTILELHDGIKPVAYEGIDVHAFQASFSYHSRNPQPMDMKKSARKDYIARELEFGVEQLRYTKRP